MLALLQAAADSPELPGGYLMDLLRALLALAAVCLLAWVALRWASRFGFGKGGQGGRIEILERVALDPRRSLYLVKLGDRVLLVGAGDGGAPSLIKELDESELPEPVAGEPVSFRSIFGKQKAEESGS